MGEVRMVPAEPPTGFGEAVKEMGGGIVTLDGIGGVDGLDPTAGGKTGTPASGNREEQ